MTPAEFAEAHGLSVEEATYILSRRAAPAEPGATTMMFDGSEVMGTPVRGDGSSRVDRARSILALAQKRVGVHPVTEELEKVYDPDADVGKVEFYEKKGRVETDPPKRFGDWEEPP